jgi:hypothetical protein
LEAEEGKGESEGRGKSGGGAALATLLPPPPQAHLAEPNHMRCAILVAWAAVAVAMALVREERGEKEKGRGGDAGRMAAGNTVPYDVGGAMTSKPAIRGVRGRPRRGQKAADRLDTTHH